jgi:hypothetical protein
METTDSIVSTDLETTDYELHGAVSSRCVGTWLCKSKHKLFTNSEDLLQFFSSWRSWHSISCRSTLYRGSALKTSTLHLQDLYSNMPLSHCVYKNEESSSFSCSDIHYRLYMQRNKESSLFACWRLTAAKVIHCLIRNEWWIEKVKRRNGNVITTTVRREQGKQRKTSVRIVILPAEIRTADF